MQVHYNYLISFNIKKYIEDIVHNETSTVLAFSSYTIYIFFFLYSYFEFLVTMATYGKLYNSI